MKSKTIYVVVSYRTEVPVDADFCEIQEAVEDELEDLRISIKTESDDEDQQEPWVTLKDVNVCNSYQLGMR